MNWKAFIAFIVLATTVILPAAQALMPAEEVTLFIIDEEKGKTNGKVFSPTEEHLPAFEDVHFIETLLADLATISQIPVDRAMELQTPPPDFC